MRKVLAGMGLVVALGLGACGGEDEPQSGNVTLQVQMYSTLDPAWKAVVERFEAKHPNIKVRTTPVPPESWQSVFLTKVQAGNAPDVFFVGPGNNNPYSVFPLGPNVLLDLSALPTIKALPDYIKQGGMQIRGKSYMNIMGFAISGLVYNRKLMSELGVNPPKSLGEMLTFCKKAKAAGKLPIVVFGAAGGFSQLGATLATAYVYSKDPKWTTERNAGRVNFASSPLWKSALDGVAQMRDAGCYGPPKEVAGLTQPAAFSKMSSGQAIMMQGAGAYIPALEKLNPKLDLGLLNQPGLAVEDQRVFVNYIGLGASAKTKHPEEVKQLLEFAGQPAQTKVWGELNATVTPSEFAEAKLPGFMREIAPDVEAGRVLPNPAYSFPSAESALLVSATDSPIAGIFTGQLSTDDVLKRLDQAWGK